MAYDKGLAERIRERVEGIAGVSSKEMFGGLCFLLDGKMFIGIVRDELMVRVGKDRHEEFVARPGARTMDFTGRPMVGYVFVSPSGFRADATLNSWVDAGIAFTRTVPTKPRQKSRIPVKPSPGRKRRSIRL
jgi:TfoX/Sxy family transcriptional regulator of competence genes